MPRMHKLSLISITFAIVFQHADSILVPLLDGCKSLCCLLILLKQLLLVLLSLVELLLLLKLDE